MLKFCKGSSENKLIVKKLNPLELRKSMEDVSLGQAEGVGTGLSKEINNDSEEYFDLSNFLQKGFRHKKILFITAILSYVGFAFLYTYKGTWYEVNITAIYNNSKNNTLFRALDMTVDNGSDSSDVDVSKALAALKSEAFLSFCYKSSLSDPDIAKLFGFDLKGVNTASFEAKAKEGIKYFINNRMVLTSVEPVKNKKNSQSNFSILLNDVNPALLKSYSEKITKLISDYFVVNDGEELVVARKIIQDKIDNVQKILDESNDKRLKLTQSIPLVDKSSIYSLQGQLQATRMAISGNKVLESQFQEKLTDIEKKIKGIRGVEDDEYGLSQELASLSNQKSELRAQGIEKESFVFKNLSNSLANTLKYLENSKSESKVPGKNENSSFNTEKVSELNNVFDEINSYLNKKIGTRDLGKELKNSLSITFPENGDTKPNESGSIPIVSKEIIRELKDKVQSVKFAIQGNNFFELRLKDKILGIEKKLDALNDASNKIEKNYYSTTIQDISNMAYLQNQLKMQGVDEDSIMAKRVSESLDKATKELEKKKNISLKDLKVDDLYMPDESSLYQQRETLEKIKGENSFYEAKVLELSKSLDELTFMLNDKTAKEAQLAELTDYLKTNQSTLDLLKNSLLKMEIVEFKGRKKISFFYDPIEERKLIPLSFFLLISLVLSFLVGLCLSYLKELNNPLLTTVKSFEERGNSVLGAVPSTKNALFQDAQQIDVFTNMSYLRLGISLENMFSYLQGKVILVTSGENSLNSATISLNLGSFFGSTGRKVLIIESDLIHNSVAKLTGAPLNGGVTDLYLHKDKVEVFPYKINEGLDVIAGDPLQVPSLSRLASPNFKDLLVELSVQYDFIFIHARPCLEAPDASDLSRYSEVSVVCCDVEKINLNKLDKLNLEMKAFLSQQSCFILENAQDVALASLKVKKQAQEDQKEAA